MQLQSDFKRIISAAFPTRNPSTQYTSLFYDNWPKWASKVIRICSTLKIREVKEFLFENEDLLNEGKKYKYLFLESLLILQEIKIFKLCCFTGKHDAILALFLLPLCLTVVKNIKQGKSETISLSKYDNSKSFILHIKVIVRHYFIVF